MSIFSFSVSAALGVAGLGSAGAGSAGAGSAGTDSGLGTVVQQELRPDLTVKAIVGAAVQVDPTTLLSKATVVIKDGQIVAVGPNVKAPAGAEVIDGTGLTVYAGFIDGWARKGQSARGDRPRQDMAPDAGQDIVSQMRIGAASNEADVRGADLFNPDDEAWRAARAAGFTSALVAPATGVISGQPSLIEIDGRPRRFSTLVPSVGVEFRFSGGGFGGFGGRSYPGTPLGNFATARQAIYDAERLAQERSAAAAGFPSPVTDDPALEALARSGPFLLEASTMPEIDRVIDFGAEFSRPTVLLGGGEAYKIVDRVKLAKAVILALDFGPEPIPATPPRRFGGGGGPGGFGGGGGGNAGTPGGNPAANPAAPGGRRGQGQRQPGQGQPGQGLPGQVRPGGTPGQTPAQTPVPAPGGGRRRGGGTDPDAPEGKKQEDEALWLERVGNAAALEKAGVGFALSSEGLTTPDEFFTNLRRAVKQGLSKKAALAGITTMPADYFGVRKWLGTIEAGKRADLTIVTGDIWADGAKVKLLFIGGAKIDPNQTAVQFTAPIRFGEEE
jgi:hypothetical protein